MRNCHDDSTSFLVLFGLDNGALVVIAVVVTVDYLHVETTVGLEVSYVVLEFLYGPADGFSWCNIKVAVLGLGNILLKAPPVLTIVVDSIAHDWLGEIILIKVLLKLLFVHHLDEDGEWVVWGTFLIIVFII